LAHDYEGEIIKAIQEQPRPKTVIAKAAKGHYPDALAKIDNLCERGILENKVGILNFKAYDVVQEREFFRKELKEFKTVFHNNLIPELKKIREKTREPIFYVTIENNAQSFHVNIKARDFVLSPVMFMINRLVRISFGLYMMKLLGQVPRPHSTMIDDDIKSCFKIIKDTKEELGKLMSKKNRPSFENYWNHLTQGLRINF